MLKRIDEYSDEIMQKAKLGLKYIYLYQPELGFLKLELFTDEGKTEQELDSFYQWIFDYSVPGLLKQLTEYYRMHLVGQMSQAGFYEPNWEAQARRHCASKRLRLC